MGEHKTPGPFHGPLSEPWTPAVVRDFALRAWNVRCRPAHTPHQGRI